MMKTYPLTQSQMGIFIECLENPESTQYNLPFVTRLSRNVDSERLSEAIKTVLRNDPAYYIKIVMQQESYYQYANTDMEITIPIVSMEEDDVQACIHRFIRPFDLLHDSLTRIQIISTPAHLYLLIDMHHIITDGASIMTTFDEIDKAYGGYEIQHHKKSIFEYAEKEQSLFGDEMYQKAAAYYKGLFDGIEMSHLPMKLSDGESVCRQVSEYLSRTVIDDFCRKYAVKPNLLFMSAFEIVLSRVTRENTVGYTTSYHGRNDKDYRDTIGMFVKTIPFAFSIDGATDVLTFLHGHEGRWNACRDNAVYPFTHFCRDLHQSPGIAFSFQGSAVKMQSLFLGEKVQHEQYSEGTTIDAVVIQIFGNKDDYEIRLRYADGQYTSNLMDVFISSMKECILQMIRQPMNKLANISIVDDIRKESLIQLGAGETLDYNREETFVDMFRHQALSTPNDIAVVDSDSHFTYSELDHRSDILAHLLISHGVRPDDFVCVMMERRKEFILCIHGIHKAAAAYTPLDIEYPTDRLQYMIDNSESKVLLTSHEVLDKKCREEAFSVDESRTKIIYIDDVDFSVSSDPVNLCTPSNLAYMIYTSGSTGRPKGTMLHQAGLRNFIEVVKDMEKLTSSDRIESHRSFSFDAHIEDIYAVLTLGGSVHIMPNSIRKDLDAIHQFLLEHQITGGGYATAIGALLLNTYPDLPVRFITMGGEKLEGVYSDTVRIINVYGPTECTDDTSYYVVEPSEHVKNIPIGKTVANCWSFIVDRSGNLVPQGVAGELCFAGIQVGRGYWHLPEKTSEVFGDCPFVKEDRWGRKVRMYHTGDLARYNKDGELEYLGRIDNQVKLRGFRIELGEIESRAISYSETIKSVAAEVKEINGIQHLCLYYVSEVEVNEDELKARMAATLTEYMVPDAFMCLETMPLTPNGKIDRRALPVPELKAEEIVAPETGLEKRLFDVAVKLLGHDQFGVTTNLIKVGMSSLMAMRLSVAIRQQLNLIVETKDILATPTLRQLAAVAKDIDSTAEHVWEKREYYPITENQRGVYIDWELHRDTTQYNIPSAEKLTDMDAEQLRDALIRVVDAHPYLKTRFAMKDGDVVQRRNDEEPASVELHILDTEPDSAFFQQRIRAFNLLEDRLYRIEIYQTPSSVYLFTDFHHTIYDGLSSAVFMSDLQKACRGEHLQTETYCSYEHSLDEQQLMQGKTYEDAESYFDQLLDGVESLSYPQSQDVKGNASGSGTVQTEIDGSAIRSFCREHGLTENSYFMTVLLQVLHRVTRENSIQILSINNGRTDSRLSNAVGMYVKTLPVVSVMDAEKESKETVAELTDEMQNQFRKTQSLDFYPFTQMVERHHLRSEIMYVYQGGLFENASFENAANVTDLQLDTVKFPLNVICYPSEKDGYGVSLEYDTSLYSQKDMETLTSMLKTAAEESAEVSLIKEVSLVGAADRKNLLSLSEGEPLDYNYEETFVDMFRHQTAQRPNAIAVVDKQGSISYGELDRRSDILAAKLQQLGVGKDNFVCLMLPRSLEFEVSILGVFKSGGAYVPLDSDYPNERLLYMLEDSESKVLITTHALFEEKQQSGDFHAANVLFMDDMDWNETVEPVNASRLENLAYMIYTSGSTGKPKGVMIEHRGLSSFLMWEHKYYKISSLEHCAAFASFSFDASVIELFCPLLVGATLYIIPSTIRHEMDELYHYIVENQIRGLYLSTQLGTEMLKMYDLPLRYLVLGGEKLTQAIPSSVVVFNEYGPTEFTVCSSFHIIDNEKDYKNIPIGRPVPNSSSFIVDRYGNLLPQGIAGELCLMGTQIARGYWKREDLTEKAFTPCPFIPERSMYHTGDLARWNEEGELEYLGRIDNQVKLRGFRIEMGEIESCAMAFSEDIKSVAAGVKEINGTQHLCLFYVSDSEINEDDLKTHLAATLTEYMIPDAFMRLEVMPLTPNGKIDRKALPVPTMARKEYVEPSTEMERYFCNTFARILKLERVGATDHFFQIGGSSLIAMRVVAAFAKDGYRIAYADLFNHATARSLATLIEDQRIHKDEAEPDWDVDVENYDYSSIERVLRDNILGVYQKNKEKTLSLDTVLLTGATGYLGIHVLHELLMDQSISQVYCIVRDDKTLRGRSRIQTLLFYYFDNTYEELFDKRIFVISGDVTDAKSFAEAETQMDGNSSSITVINCAANVKHFSAGTDIEDVNIGGVKNCINFCLHSGARLIQTSTVSIGGCSASETYVTPHQIKEYELYIGQKMGSKYPYSKFIAERMVLEAIATQGLNGKIMRLGNLSARSTDGEFQINFRTNSFIGSMKAYQMLQCMPYSVADMQVEFSPIDEVARAVILLSKTPRECTVFQPFNVHTQLFGDVLGCLSHIGYGIRYVEDDEFNKLVAAALEDTKKASILQSLLAYKTDQGKGKYVVYNTADSEYTAQVLYRLRFSWSITTWDYIEKFEKILHDMGLFDDNYTR